MARIKTWYRGFKKQYGLRGTYSPHLLWLTDDIEYAQSYGDTVMAFEVDIDKCNGSIYDLDEGTDYYDGPCKEEAEELLNQGINSYMFYANDDSSLCMCLWDETPIVSQRILDNNEINENKNMKKNIEYDMELHANAINESKNRTVDLRDPDDYIPFDEYEAFEEAHKMRLQAKANELQRYVDDTLAEKSPISVRYKETMRLGVVQPHILVNNNGQFYFFTDCDKAENKVKEMVDSIMNANTSNTVKLNEAQLRAIIAESIKKVLNEGVYDNERALGAVSPWADPNGYLDGVTDMEGCERCGYDLFIAFDKKDTESFNGIVYVGKNNKDNKEINDRFRHNPKYWCVNGSVVDYTPFGGEKILQLYLS